MELVPHFKRFGIRKWIATTTTTTTFLLSFAIINTIHNPPVWTLRGKKK